MTEQHQVYQRRSSPAQRSYATVSLGDRMVGAARAQPAGLLLLVAGTSLMLSGMRSPSASLRLPNGATARRASNAARKMAQGDFSDVGSTVSSARDGMGDMVSGVRDQIGQVGSKAGEVARSYTESLSGFADDAQQTVRQNSQWLAETARSSAQSSASFVLEDQPLLLGGARSRGGCNAWCDPAEHRARKPPHGPSPRQSRGTRQRHGETKTGPARQRGLGSNGSTEECRQRGSLNADQLTDVAKDVVQPFANVASGGGSSGSSSTSQQGIDAARDRAVAAAVAAAPAAAAVVLGAALDRVAAAAPELAAAAVAWCGPGRCRRKRLQQPPRAVALAAAAEQAAAAAEAAAASAKSLELPIMSEVDALERDVVDARARLLSRVAQLKSPGLTGLKEEFVTEATAYKDEMVDRAKQKATSTVDSMVADLKSRAAANPIAVAAIGCGHRLEALSKAADHDPACRRGIGRAVWAFQCARDRSRSLRHRASDELCPRRYRRPGLQHDRRFGRSKRRSAAQRLWLRPCGRSSANCATKPSN